MPIISQGHQPHGPSSQIPVWAAVHLTHAALQAVADAASVDILHIKGPTDARFRSDIHDSTDADVLVRPDHLDRFISALTERGWSLYSGFEEGSPFGHAANFKHPSWVWVDIHRAIPGFRSEPAHVFDELWREREIVEIAHWPCTVLAPHAQVLIQVMHVARSHGAERPDTWDNSPGDVRANARELAEALGGETAFAAGIGELEEHRDKDDHALWKYWSERDNDRLAEWSARLRSASGTRERLAIVRQVARVNRTHLRLRLGHEPTRRELAKEQFARIRKAIVTATKRLSRRPGPDGAQR